MLGFNFYASSPRAIAPAKARAIIARLPRESFNIALFVNAARENVMPVIAPGEKFADGRQAYSALQFHGEESADYCRGWDLKVIKAFRLKDKASLAALAVMQREAHPPILAAAGMAQPQRFFAMLRDRGLSIEKCPLPDHHDFKTLPWPADTPDVLVTEKDAVKLDPARVGSTRVWVATLDFTLPASFEAALLAHLPPSARRGTR